MQNYDPQQDVIPAAPEPQRDHRIVRREETDRLSG